MKLPLEGIRVIELGTYAAVPGAARMLADLGAEVIKVESMEGDAWRSIGLNYCTPCTDEENPIFTFQNANKKLVCADLKSVTGRALLLDLVKKSDVFMTSVRASSLKGMGLDYDSVRSAIPEVVYADFTGYGDRGPEAGKPGFDLSAFWARSGMMVDSVEQGAFPLRPTGAVGDLTASAMMVAGILTALLARVKTGLGTRVTSSLFACGLWYAGTGVISAQYGNPYPKDRTHPVNPLMHIYACSDGEWVLSAFTNYNKNQPAIFHALDLDDQIGDERFTTIKACTQKENVPQIVALLSQAFLKRTSAEWQVIFKALDQPLELLGHHADCAADEQALANGFLTPMQFPSGNSVMMPTVPIQFADYQGEPGKDAGAVGRDTDEVLAAFGYDEAARAELRAAGAIQ